MCGGTRKQLKHRLQTIFLQCSDVKKYVQVATEIIGAHGKEARKEPKRHLHLHFLESPSQVLIDSSSGEINGLEVDKQMNTFDESGKQVQMRTGEKEAIPMQLLLKSVGYRGHHMEGAPFSEAQGIVPNQMGRVTDASGQIRPGLYVAGWIKRGPVGVIGTNILDAAQTAQCVHEDFPHLSSNTSCDDLPKVLEVGSRSICCNCGCTHCILPTFAVGLE